MGKFGLLLILVALFIQGITATVDVNEGKLSQVNQLDALAAIAGQSDGDALLGLLNGTDEYWHPMAFWRYLILRAPADKETPDFNKENELLSEVNDKGGLSDTKRSAVKVYSRTEHVKGVGNVNITAWSLVYSCLLVSASSSQCAALAPVFITKANKRPEYVSLFRGFFPGNDSTYFASSVSADLAKLQDQGATQSLQNCITNSSVQAVARSLLSASYGLPGFVCYDSSSNLTSFKRVFSNQHTLAGDIISWPKMKTEECAAAPFLQDNYDSFMACAKNGISYYCITVLKQSSSCSYSKTIDAMFQSITNNETTEACGVYSSNVYMNSGYTYVTSIWETTDGEDKHEFEKGQAIGDFCYMKVQNTISHPVSCTVYKSSSRCDPTYFSEGLLDAFLKDTADTFLSGHVTLFNVKRGPSAGKIEAAALAMATFLGLISMVGPFTRGELKFFRKCFHCKCFRSNSMLKILGCIGLCFLNVGLGCAVYGPIIVAMQSQYEKLSSFDTWAISTTSEVVNAYGAKLLFLTFVEGTSTYSNRFIWSVYIASCFLALVITAALTCYEFFHAPHPDPAQVHKEGKDQPFHPAQVHQEGKDQPFHRYSSMVNRKNSVLFNG